MITRNQWEQLKKGDVLLTQKGQERKILNEPGGSYVQLAHIKGKGYLSETRRNYSELCYSHSVKDMTQIKKMNAFGLSTFLNERRLGSLSREVWNRIDSEDHDKRTEKYNKVMQFLIDNLTK